MPTYKLYRFDSSYATQDVYIIQAESKLAMFENILTNARADNIQGELLIWLCGDEHCSGFPNEWDERLRRPHIVLLLKSLQRSLKDYEECEYFILHDRRQAIDYIKQIYTTAQQFLDEYEEHDKLLDGCSYKEIEEIPKYIHALNCM